MTFREALNQLKEKYGNTASLSYMEHAEARVPSIFAHGNGSCGISETYEGAISALELALNPVDQSPEDSIAPEEGKRND